MVNEIKSFPLNQGYAGELRSDEDGGAYPILVTEDFKALSPEERLQREQELDDQDNTCIACGS